MKVSNGWLDPIYSRSRLVCSSDPKIRLLDYVASTPRSTARVCLTNIVAIRHVCAYCSPCDGLSTLIAWGSFISGSREKTMNSTGWLQNVHPVPTWYVCLNTRRRTSVLNVSIIYIPVDTWYYCRTVKNRCLLPRSLCRSIMKNRHEH